MVILLEKYAERQGVNVPLIALQYHEVKINIEFETLANCTKAGTTADLTNASLWVDDIFLDTDERKFACAQELHATKVGKSFQVASRAVKRSLGETPCCGELLLNLTPPSGYWKRYSWPRRKLGYGKRRVRWDNPHAYNLRTLCQVYGWASETERVLGCDKNIDNSCNSNIQSMKHRNMFRFRDSEAFRSAVS